MILFTTPSSVSAATPQAIRKELPSRNEVRWFSRKYQLLVIALCFALLAAINYFEKVHVVGRVVDQQDKSVAGARIDVFPLGGSTGVLPSTQTDADGKYDLILPAIGRTIVTASKEREGYPNALIALYGSSYSSLKTVDISGHQESVLADLRFSEPDATIDWTIRKSEESRAPKVASYKISLLSNPRLYRSSTLPEDGHIRFVLPRAPVQITISAENCEDWTSSKDGQDASGLLLALGRHDTRTILLHCKRQ